MPAVQHPAHSTAVLAVPEALAEAEVAVFRFSVVLRVPAALTAEMVEPDLVLVAAKDKARLPASSPPAMASYMPAAARAVQTDQRRPVRGRPTRETAEAAAIQTQRTQQAVQAAAALCASAITDERKGAKSNGICSGKS